MEYDMILKKRVNFKNRERFFFFDKVYKKVMRSEHGQWAGERKIVILEEIKKYKILKVYNKKVQTIEKKIVRVRKVKKLFHKSGLSQNNKHCRKPSCSVVMA